MGWIYTSEKNYKGKTSDLNWESKQFNVDKLDESTKVVVSPK